MCGENLSNGDIIPHFIREHDFDLELTEQQLYDRLSILGAIIPGIKQDDNTISLSDLL
jgi:hypothetical protein